MNVSKNITIAVYEAVYFTLCDVVRGAAHDEVAAIVNLNSRFMMNNVLHRGIRDVRSQ